MDAQAFAIYAAGFFDGEGWIGIKMEPGSETRSDVHRLSAYVSQRARRREVLDQFQAHFGGKVTIRDSKLRNSERWAEQADWHVHSRVEVEQFCRAVQPYCIVKAEHIRIALEYIETFHAARPVRDELGRIHGKALDPDEAQRREHLRAALTSLNARGSDRTTQMPHAPRVIQRRDRSHEVLTANPKTVSRGEHRYNSVLTEDTVRVIRDEHASGGMTMEAMGIKYGVSPAAIRQVVRRISWAHVT